MFIVKQVFSIT